MKEKVEVEVSTNTFLKVFLMLPIMKINYYLIICQIFIN